MKKIIENASAYDMAIKMIARRDLSEAALRVGLKKAGYSGNDIEPAIQRLIEYRLIDDLKCARRIVEVHSSAERGRMAFSRLLTSKGFKRDVIDAALEPLDYNQQIESAARLKQQLSGRYAGKPAREAKVKLSQALSRRGFAWDIISQVMDGEAWDS
jgi:regulatory protein